MKQQISRFWLNTRKAYVFIKIILGPQEGLFHQMIESILTKYIIFFVKTGNKYCIIYLGESLDYREEESCVHVTREGGEAGWLAGGLRMLGLLFPVAMPLHSKPTESALERIYLIQMYCFYFIK